MFGLFDYLLMVGVTAQATVIAYIRNPSLKSLALVVPIASTIGIIALDQPVDITNLIGLIFLLSFSLAVFLLHSKQRLPILLAIVLSALLYCGPAVFIAPHLPRQEWFFWVGAALVSLIAWLTIKSMPPREEPHHATSLPVWLKTIAVALVVVGLVLIKKQMQGFFTTFPMVGVIAAYETRNSLYTTARRMPEIIISSLGMLITCRLLQDRIGLIPSLIPGIAAYIIALMLFQRLAGTRMLDCASDSKA